MKKNVTNFINIVLAICTFVVPLIVKANNLIAFITFAISTATIFLIRKIDKDFKFLPLLVPIIINILILVLFCIQKNLILYIVLPLTITLSMILSMLYENKLSMLISLITCIAIFTYEGYSIYMLTDRDAFAISLMDNLNYADVALVIIVVIAISSALLINYKWSLSQKSKIEDQLNLLEITNKENEENIKSLEQLKADIIKIVKDINEDSSKIKEFSDAGVIEFNELMNDTISQDSYIQNIKLIFGQFNNLIGNNSNFIQQVDSSMNKLLNKVEVNKKEMNDLQQQSDIVNDSIKLLIEKIEEIKTYSDDINRFTELINSIASKINLLSLNASIESSRAGEAGKSFGVVAEEVKKLAYQTKTYADEIQTTMGNIVDNIYVADELTKQSNEFSSKNIQITSEVINTFNEIYDNVILVNEQTQNITKENQRISEDSAELSDLLDNVSRISNKCTSSIKHNTDNLETQKIIITNTDSKLKDLTNSL